MIPASRRGLPVALLLLFALPALPACDEEEEEPVFGEDGPPPRTPLRRLTPFEWNNAVRDLFPVDTSPRYEFPSELAVQGFENNAELQGSSPLLVEAYREAAMYAMSIVEPQMFWECEGDPDEAGCTEDFLRGLLRRAFRRPVTDEDIEAYGGFVRRELEEVSFRQAMQLVAAAILQDPEFLFRPEWGEAGAAADEDDRIPLTPWETATRLSFLIWASVPDDELLDAAEAGELSTADQLEAQARRMLDDPRARTAILDFHRQWLSLDAIWDIEVQGLYQPLWNRMIRFSLREASDRTLDWLLFEGPGTLDGLLTDDHVAVNWEMAMLYDVPSPSGEWDVVRVDERAGVLTDPGILASHSHSIHPSPTLRGQFVLDRFLCAPMDPPPAGLTIFPPRPEDFQGSTTNRERYERRTDQPECRSCHEPMHGVGFAFEHYDMLGVYRRDDFGGTIDASGLLQGTDVDGAVDGALDLAQALASSSQVERCYATQWFRFAFGRVDKSWDAPVIDQIHAPFAASGGEVAEVIVSVARADAFRTRTALRPGE